MDWGKFKYRSRSLAMVVLLMASIPCAAASPNPAISGTYHAERESRSGNEVRVRLQVHLVNRDQHDLHIHHITLWDFAHPARGATQTCAIALAAASSTDVTQEFTISQAEYELWERGARPRVVLEIAGSAGHSRTEVVHLDPISDRKGD